MRIQVETRGIENRLRTRRGNPRPPRGSRLWIPFLLLALLVGAFTLAAYYYYRDYRAGLLASVESQLASIADLKVNELVQWRKERLMDGDVLSFTSRYSDVQHFLANPADAADRSMLLGWMKQLVSLYGYSRIVLMDNSGVERLAFPGPPEESPALVKAKLPGVLKSHAVEVLDFYRDSKDGQVAISIVVPILGDKVDSEPVGIFVLQVDPNSYLYPLMERWPTPSKTSETLLVRRDGDSVLFLNKLRFDKNAALNLRIPLSNTGVASVRAIEGYEGPVSGVDYRGVPVFANVRAVPDSPWFMVAKMDQSEAFAPLKGQLVELLLLIGALLIGALAVAGFILRQGTISLYRAKVTAAEALRESESKFSILFNQASLPTALTRFPDFAIVDVNEAWTQRFGYTKEESIGKTSSELGMNRNPERRARTVEALGRHNEVRDLEQTLYTKSGVPLTVLSNYNIITIAGQDYALTSIQDITARKIAEEDLQETTNYLDSLITYANAPIIVWDPARVITRFNHAFEELTGYLADEVIGRDLGMLFPDDTKADSLGMIELTLIGEYWESVEIPIQRKDGKVRTALWNSANIYAKDGSKLLSTIAQGVDITDRKRAEEELNEAIVNLARSNEELEQFAFIASHDLQEPLRMIASFSQLLAKKYHDKLDAEAHEFINYAVDGATRMQRLIQELLAYSRVTTRGKEFALVDLEDVLNDTKANLRPAIEETGAEISNCPLPVVHADYSQMLQLFQNLVVNAIKFRGDSPPRVRFFTEERPEEWVISVKDNGMGIESKYFDRIFVIFQRLHGAGQYSGTGLGLAIARRIVHRHGGRIWVESEPGKGTVFSFSIPKDGGNDAVS